MRTIAMNLGTRVCTGYVFCDFACFMRVCDFSACFWVPIIGAIVTVSICTSDPMLSRFILSYIYISSPVATQAAYRNLPAMCEMLIRFGTDVNAQNRQGQTALHLVRVFHSFVSFGLRPDSNGD